MTLFRPLAALLLLALAACATTVPEPAAPDYYVMRHLQKNTEGGQDPGLTDAGYVWAGNLALWFDRHPPSAIYVSRTRRAQDTAASVAAKFHVTPTIYDPADTPGLIAAVSRERGTVLIVGHSNTVPEIVAGLGGERPPALGEMDYGDVWHVWSEPRRTEKLSVAP
jgi:phosphohistidine phosphatase SixA